MYSYIVCMHTKLYSVYDCILPAPLFIIEPGGPAEVPLRPPVPGVPGPVAPGTDPGAPPN